MTEEINKYNNKISLRNLNLNLLIWKNNKKSRMIKKNKKIINKISEISEVLMQRIYKVEKLVIKLLMKMISNFKRKFWMKIKKVKQLK